MNNETDKGEINLNLLFINIYKRKFLIILIMLISLIFGCFYIRSSTLLYQVYLEAHPVNSDALEINSNRSSGIFDMFRASAGSKSNSPLNKYVHLYHSDYISQELFKDQTFVKTIFSNQWDYNTNDWIAPESSFKLRTVNLFRKVLGLPSIINAPPNSQSLNGLIKRIKILRKSYGIKFLLETDNPKRGIFLITETHKITDRILKNRSLLESNEKIQFIKQQINLTNQSEHKQVLIKMLSSLQKQLIIASSDFPVAVEPVGNFIISSNPIKPKVDVILIFSLAFGFLIGVLFTIFTPVIKIGKIYL